MSPKFFVVGALWVEKCFSWVLRGPKSFYRGYVVGRKDFMVGTLWVVSTWWVQHFLLWVLRGSEIFYCRYFVGPEFFLVGVSQVQNFSRGYFVGWKFFSCGYFMGFKFFS